MKQFNLVTIFLPLILLISNCSNLASHISTTPVTTKDVTTPRNLTICLGYEPESLYPYGASSQAAWGVLEAIYDGPIDTVNYQLSPVILDSLPSLTDGSLTFQPVEVKAGDEVINADGYLVSLAAGVTLFPSGCTSPECLLTWDGTSPLQMDQMTATFSLKAGLKWSDGQPLTTVDSVYSFQLASDPATPVEKSTVDQTASYTALDEHQVVWVSKPGLVTAEIQRYFWMPLPQHAWGKYSAEELLTAEESSRTPLGWGAYVIQEWKAGEYIRLTKNPNYFRAGQGLQNIDFLEYRILDQGLNPVEMVKTGKCDVVDSTAIPYEALQSVMTESENGIIKSFIQTGKEWEILAFGIRPVSYDDGYYPYGSDRPDLFADARTRKAIAFCIDRAGIIDDLLFGLSEVPINSLPSTHPWQVVEISTAPMDISKANELLLAAGWTDYDQNPATPRVAANVNNVLNGTLLSFNYFIGDSELQDQIADRIVTSLAQCGIQVTLSKYSVNELYKPAPDGVLFGRKFDLAQLAWQLGNEIPCEMFISSEIPTQNNYWLGEVSGGANFSGYTNSQMDEGCQIIRRSGLNDQLRLAKIQEMMNLIAQDYPVIPLYFYPQVVVSRPDICGLTQDCSSQNFFQDLESLDYDETCLSTG